MSDDRKTDNKWWFKKKVVKMGENCERLDWKRKMGWKRLRRLHLKNLLH